MSIKVSAYGEKDALVRIVDAADMIAMFRAIEDMFENKAVVVRVEFRSGDAFDIFDIKRVEKLSDQIDRTWAIQFWDGSEWKWLRDYETGGLMKACDEEIKITPYEHLHKYKMEHRHRSVIGCLARWKELKGEEGEGGL